MQVRGRIRARTGRREGTYSAASPDIRLVSAAWPSTSPPWELHLRAERKSPETVGSYGDRVRRFLAWADGEGRPAVLDRVSVHAFTADLLEGGGERTTARARQLAQRRFSAWLLEEDESDADLLLGLRSAE